MSGSPPLRFLVLLLAGWGGIRAALLFPGFWAPPAGAGGQPRQGRPARSDAPGAKAAAPMPTPLAATLRAGRRPGGAGAAPKALEAVRPAILVAATGLGSAAPGGAPPASPVRTAAAPGRAETASRWSFAAWSFLRAGEEPSLAAGGMLGGSQAGVRLLYRLNADPGRPLALAARLSAPVGRAAGAEAAVGLDWKPSRRLPLHLAAERRQKLGREGRSAFAVILYGGVSDLPLSRLRIDGYAQAGLVGLRSRDPFADGALRLSLPLGRRARLGAGAWGSAQPGLDRLDLGPQASLRLPVAGRTVTLAADWRQRIGGNARPGSGPTLSLATDF